MTVCHIDFETCSALDLRKVGADVYSRDPSLIVTVLAYAFDGGPVQSCTNVKHLPVDLFNHLVSGGEFRAWSASFEWAILTNHFKLKLDPAQAVCVQQKALHSGLPASLEDAGPAIGAKIHKDASARRLMLQLSKPRKHKDGSTTFWHVDEPTKLVELAVYCVRDVESERAIDSMIADLPVTEQHVSIMDRKANNLGVMLDREFIVRLKALAMDETTNLNQQCTQLTKGAITSPGTQTAKLLAWLQSYGLPLMDVGKDSITAMLSCEQGGTVRRVLEIRQEVAKSSIKKLDAMLRCMGPGDRVRGQLAYYGAFRTGRFAGRLIQPQNFPRAAFKTMRLLMRYLVLAAHVDVDFIRLCWGNPLDAVASALRGCLIPAVGKVFIVRDLSQIEARVIAWLAGQQDILDVFAAGKDVYTYTQILLGLRSRQEGKVVVLGLGFGMGPGRFQENAASNGLKFTAEECEHIVKEWRAANPKIVQFWWDLDNAAKNVIGDWHAHPAHPVTIRWVGKKIELQTSRARNGSCLLTILLPSGRRLYYRNARLEQDPDNAMRVQIVYSGVDTYTKKWTDVRTYGAKLAENITQAVARDVIVEAALRVDAQNLGKLVLSVHDELLFEVDELDAQACEGFISVEINARPNWAPDLPVASEGGILRRYGK